MITPNNFSYKKFNFPTGEMHVEIVSVKNRRLSLEFEFQTNEEIIELLFVHDALKNKGYALSFIEMPYIPFSRQDRITKSGDCFSLKVVSKLLNGLNVPIYVFDPHSDVSPALLNCIVIPQWEIFYPILKKKKDFWLISPDGGALKKIYKLANLVTPIGVVECSKKRDVLDGSISGTIVHANDLQGKDCYIVDDICDGGRTFIEIAKVLRTKNCGKIILCVTHGFFTKGLDVFNGYIDRIYTHKRVFK